MDLKHLLGLVLIKASSVWVPWGSTWSILLYGNKTFVIQTSHFPMRQSLSITIAANFQSFSTAPASSSSLILSVITCKMESSEKNILLSLSLMFDFTTAFTANIYHLAPS